MPATPVWRSWFIVPITGPSTAIFIDESRLGMTV